MIETLNSPEDRFEDLLRRIGDGDKWGNDDEIEVLRDLARAFASFLNYDLLQEFLETEPVEDITRRINELSDEDPEDPWISD